MERLFGTDGIRGIANRYPMNPHMALKLGAACGHLFKTKGEEQVVVGRDTRISGQMLEGALQAGITSAGVDCLKVGVLPTPGISYLTRALSAKAGIVISASHNPVEDNGIKFFGQDGYKLPDEMELMMEEEVLSEESRFISPVGTDLGQVREINDAGERYIEFLNRSISSSLHLKGLRIVIDCANGATSGIVPRLLEDLGAKLIVMNANPDGKNINLNCGSLHPEIMSQAVRDHQANLGLSFDGDGDRLIAVDEKGQVVDGDKIMVICALNLKEKGILSNHVVVVTVMSNIGLERALSPAGIKIVRTKVGDRYVVEGMQKEGANLGGEQSGHLIFLDHNTTGDGIITALQLLNVLREEDAPLSELAKKMKRFPQTLLNIGVKSKPNLTDLPEVMDAITTAENKLGEDGRVLVRYSGTEPKVRVMVEGPTVEETETMAKSIAAAIEKEIGQ
ncbi:MAG: phosphoglucosamine mutase [bacterium]